MVMDTNIMQRSSESEDGVCHSSTCPMPVNTSSVLNVKVGVCYPSVCSANEFAVMMIITGVVVCIINPFSDITPSILTALIISNHITLVIALL